MAIIKWNRENDNLPVFSNLWDNFLNRDLDDFYFNSNMLRTPSVNIIEGKEDFLIEVAAPGMQKKDFSVNIEHNLLTIEAKKESKSESKDERYTRREFNFNSFRRSFTLPESIVQEKIDAKYEDGILRIILPKKEEAKVKPSREIAIA
jgi:HSP20 family protein